MSTTIQPNINGVTLSDVTRLMRTEEKTIGFFNEKYNFQIETKGSLKEISEYNNSLSRWDNLKSKRDILAKKHNDLCNNSIEQLNRSHPELNP